MPSLTFSLEFVFVTIILSSIWNSNKIPIAVVNGQQHTYTDSFPRNDEYDMMLIDPETPYGTPYGGFSRATASRLASLPLKLPDIINENLDEFEPMYTTIRDSLGRPFVCRVYHQDELNEKSLEDSMFNTPKLKVRPNNNEPEKGKETTLTDDATIDKKDDATPNNDEHRQHSDSATATTTNSEESSTDKSSPVGARNAVKSKGPDSEKAALEAAKTKKRTDPVLLAQEVHQRLSILSGLCAQIHPDWWSYEWCYQEKVIQFHIHVDTDQSNNKVHDIKLESISSLGRFSDRRVEMSMEGNVNDSQNKQHPQKSNTAGGLDLAGGRQELARVVDTFVGGDKCPETGKPRVTEATLRCCSPQLIAKNKGGVLKNGRPVATDLVTIVKATEWDMAVCHYNITLCTPLLCDDEEGASQAAEGTKSLLGASSSSSKKKGINLDLDPAEVEKMSIVDVLENTFGKKGDFCIQAGTGGWWVYEFCPGDSVRQFHETTLLDRITGTASTSIDTEHVLGRYIPEDHAGLTRENEWKNVINATEIGFGSGTKSANNQKKNRFTKGGSPTRLGGNGAYFFQEYTKGDVCDHEDVTDSAIKAGAFGEGGIERATTVRYSCGNQLELSVKEDSTCHYVVDISVPSLCHHPLFKAPVAKKQVVKCLPLPAL